eukprot:CAMPEP_0115463132 /NCGR_PEP_ID=MMETSP0271-20121206/48184_1 /TAXON_ID=71861 /ORGANISM="Scrippsiella trochoidea, Strain CCMP3099" /LENGTH=608 /DNA_ID=CAMNT_0002889945 /DNA_START=26 /DNA_END=1849 /DNA_ORIENTATION=-
MRALFLSAPASEDVEQSTMPAQQFAVGDRVTWVGDDEDIPRGEVGTVTGHVRDKGRVFVQFERGTFSFLPSELSRAKARSQWLGWLLTSPRWAVPTVRPFQEDLAVPSVSSSAKPINEDPRDITGKPFLPGQVVETTRHSERRTGTINTVGSRGVVLSFDDSHGKFLYDQEAVQHYGVGRGALPPQAEGPPQKSVCLNTSCTGPGAANCVGDEEVLSFLGNGKGDYIQEMTYRYVGTGLGEYGRRDVSQSSSHRWLSISASLCGISSLLLVLALFITWPIGSSPSDLGLAPSSPASVGDSGDSAPPKHEVEAQATFGHASTLSTLDMKRSCHVWCADYNASWSTDRKDWCCAKCTTGCPGSSLHRPVLTPDGHQWLSGNSPAPTPSPPSPAAATSLPAPGPAPIPPPTSPPPPGPAPPSSTKLAGPPLQPVVTTPVPVVPGKPESAAEAVAAAVAAAVEKPMEGELHATTTSEETGPIRSVQQLLFDCDKGYDDWLHGWPREKKAWCCQHAGRACFRKISVGACADVDMQPISDSKGCKRAALAMRYASENVSYTKDSVNRPEGCYTLHHLQDGTRTLWLNSNPRSRGKGAETSIPAEGLFRHPICAA